MTFLKSFLKALQDAVVALGRIADALDKITIMLSLELRSRGISHSLETGDETGELILPDGVTERDVFDRTNEAAERDRDAYLREWEESIRLAGTYGVSWSGPEGSEDPS